MKEVKFFEVRESDGAANLCEYRGERFDILDLAFAYIETRKTFFINKFDLEWPDNMVFANGRSVWSKHKEWHFQIFEGTEFWYDPDDCVALSRDQIDAIFEEAETVSVEFCQENGYGKRQEAVEIDAYVTWSLYKAVYSQWDEIAEIDGWPSISHEDHAYISEKIREAWRIRNEDQPIMSTSFNNGFSSDLYAEIKVPQGYVKLAPAIMKESA